MERSELDAAPPTRHIRLKWRCERFRSVYRGGREILRLEVCRRRSGTGAWRAKWRLHNWSGETLRDVAINDREYVLRDTAAVGCSAEMMGRGGRRLAPGGMAETKPDMVGIGASISAVAVAEPIIQFYRIGSSTRTSWASLGNVR